MAATCRPLVRKLAVREVDARDLEERDPVGAARRRCAAPPRPGSAAATCGARSARRRSAPGASTSFRRRGRERRRVRLREAEPDERVLDPAAQRLLARQRTEHRAPGGQREGHVLEPEAGYFLDDVDLARDVACAPGGRDDAAVVAVEAEAAGAARTGLRGGVSSPITASARSGRKRMTGRSGRPA